MVWLVADMITGLLITVSTVVMAPLNIDPKGMRRMPPPTTLNGSVKTLENTENTPPRRALLPWFSATLVETPLLTRATRVSSLLARKPRKSMVKVVIPLTTGLTYSYILPNILLKILPNVRMTDSGIFSSPDSWACLGFISGTDFNLFRFVKHFYKVIREVFKTFSGK